MQTLAQAPASSTAPAGGIASVDVSQPALFRDDTVGAMFARLRREDPVHYCAESDYGPYWSVTRYKDIMEVEVNHAVFSSDVWLGGITSRDVPKEHRRPSFISMDPPLHDDQRKTVSPIVAPGNLAEMEATIRERTCSVLDSLPRNVRRNADATATAVERGVRNTVRNHWGKRPTVHVLIMEV